VAIRQGGSNPSMALSSGTFSTMEPNPDQQKPNPRAWAARFMFWPQMPAAAGNEFVFYILLLVSLTEPGLALVVEQIQLQAFKARGRTDMKPINLFFTISLIKMAMVEVVYVFGFVVFLLTGEYLNMLFFYPIGVAWTLAFWPRRAKYEQLLEKLRQP